MPASGTSNRNVVSPGIRERPALCSGHAARGNGMVNHHGDADPDDGYRERNKKLAADARAQTKAAYVFRTKLEA